MKGDGENNLNPMVKSTVPVGWGKEKWKLLDAQGSERGVLLKFFYFRSGTIAFCKRAVAPVALQQPRRWHSRCCRFVHVAASHIYYYGRELGQQVLKVVVMKASIPRNCCLLHVELRDMCLRLQPFRSRLILVAVVQCLLSRSSNISMCFVSCGRIHGVKGTV